MKELKDSRVPWIGVIPRDWEVERLRRLAHRVTDGAHISPDLSSEDFPFVSTVNISNGRIDLSGCLKTSQDCYDYLVHTGCKPYRGDVLFSKDGTVGRTAIVSSDDDFVVASSLVIITPRNKRIDSRFLDYWLNNNLLKQEVSLQMAGAALRRISVGKVGRLVVLLPPLPTQFAIASYLDRKTAAIDSIIEKKQRLLALLEEKRAVLINRAVTKGLNPDVPMKDSGVPWIGDIPEQWEVKRLKQLIKLGSSISYGIVQPGPHIEDGIPFVQTTNISKPVLLTTDLQKTTQEIASMYPRSRIEEGDVILGIRASIGDVHIVPKELEGANLSRGVARIVPSKQVTSHYLCGYLSSSASKLFWGSRKQGSTFNEIPIGVVRELPIMLPPTQEQQAISDYLAQQTRKLDSIIQKETRLTELLQERRQALITAAVTGKIDVRGEEV